MSNNNLLESFPKGKSSKSVKSTVLDLGWLTIKQINVLCAYVGVHK